MHYYLIVNYKEISTFPWYICFNFITELIYIFKNLIINLWKIAKSQCLWWLIFSINPILKCSKLITKNLFTRLTNSNSRYRFADQPTILILTILYPLPFIPSFFHNRLCLLFTWTFKYIFPSSTNCTLWIILFTNYSYISQLQCL